MQVCQMDMISDKYGMKKTKEECFTATPLLMRNRVNNNLVYEIYSIDLFVIRGKEFNYL